MLIWDRELLDVEPESLQLVRHLGLGLVLRAQRARDRDEAFEEPEGAFGPFVDGGVERVKIHGFAQWSNA